MTMRVPVVLKDAIESAAAHNGRATNDEVVARLAASEDARLAAIEGELREIRRLLRELLDAAG